jgi:hypothetical protein
MDDATGKPRLTKRSETGEEQLATRRATGTARLAARRKWSRPIDQTRTEAMRQLLWQAFRHGELSDTELSRELDRLRFAHDMLEWRDPLGTEPPKN